MPSSAYPIGVASTHRRCIILEFFRVELIYSNAFCAYCVLQQHVNFAEHICANTNSLTYLLTSYLLGIVAPGVHLAPPHSLWIRLRLLPSHNLSTKNEKLSYRKDTERAHLRSLCLSRSFSVIDFDTRFKPVCSFILENNNTNLHPISRRFSVIAQ